MKVKEKLVFRQARSKMLDASQCFWQDYPFARAVFSGCFFILGAAQNVGHIDDYLQPPSRAV